MNQDNVRKLRRVLVRLQEVGNEKRFNMADFFLSAGVSQFFSDEKWSTSSFNDVPEEARDPDPEHCGTAACLAGWAYMLAMAEGFDAGGQRHYTSRIAREWLGISENEADDWFYGNWGVGKRDFDRLHGVTVAEAIRFLESKLGY